MKEAEGGGGGGKRHSEGYDIFFKSGQDARFFFNPENLFSGFFELCNFFSFNLV